EARAQANPTDSRSNILFLFADDQRADTITALGNPIIRTPYLHRLGRSGMAFNRAYMQGGLQAATCTPSRAMLLSGRSLFRIDEKLQRDPTWPNAFKIAQRPRFHLCQLSDGPIRLRGRHDQPAGGEAQ